MYVNLVLSKLAYIYNIYIYSYIHYMLSKLHFIYLHLFIFLQISY